jgi:HSP20 family protein
MHRLIKIRIIRDLEHLEDRLRAWGERLFPFADETLPFRPPADLYETPEGLVLRLEVPGVAPEDLSVDLAGQALTVRGRRRPAPPPQVLRVLHFEMTYGLFERSFHLPLAVDSEGVSARYVDGVLEIILPRHHPVSRRIPVKDLGADQD